MSSRVTVRCVHSPSVLTSSLTISLKSFMSSVVNICYPVVWVMYIVRIELLFYSKNFYLFSTGFQNVGILDNGRVHNLVGNVACGADVLCTGSH